MRHHARFGPAIGNPVANLFIVIAGILAIAVSIVLGFVALLGIVLLAAIAAVIIGVRAWWFRRAQRRHAPGERQGPARGEIIDGEYRVVDDGGERP